jgi:Asp-tRNA(Asn)/Glu-tRNA(Gln) amidotransferase A subunit family amidase
VAGEPETRFDVGERVRFALEPTGLGANGEKYMSRRAAFRAVILLAVAPWAALQQAAAFDVVETSIDEIHDALRSGETTCAQVVEAYVARARAYNGICTQLVTEDGKKVARAPGVVRAGAPLKFPTETLSVAKLLPRYAQYTGPKPDLGRMEPTMSDPSVQQQFGMVVGLSNARQVNALETLNLRGERSVTCKGRFDAPPSSGPLPAGAPAECEKFRQQPDALERAAELDKQYGRNIDTAAMPLYCVPMSFKAVYDAKDMRSTGGGDVKYATDFAPADSTLTARLRGAGAIVFAQALNSEYNGGSGDPTGAAKVSRPYLGASGARETWGGTTCNPYDTTRETGGSSGGSGSSVAANLVVCSICETTGGSCRNPGNFNGVVNLVPTKGMISYAGGIGANPWQDRPGILCRSVKDATRVFDAFRDAKTGFFDAKDPYTALSHMTASKTPYLAALEGADKPRPLAGVRIGVLRQFMVKTEKPDEAVSDGVNGQLAVLRELGAELVELTDPNYPDDPAMPDAQFTFEQALAELLPFHMPDVFAWKDAKGNPEFAVPGWDITSRKYLVNAAVHKAPWPANLNLRRMIGNLPASAEEVSGYQFSYQFGEYLARRGDARVFDWDTLNANAKYFNDVRSTAMTNWQNKAIDPRATEITYHMKRREVLRMATMKVLQQNGIDVFLSPSATVVAGKLGYPQDPARKSYGYGAVMGIPEVFVPGGFVDTIYEPKFELSADGKTYEPKSGTTTTKLANPLPFNLGFWAAPGDEAKVIAVAAAYESATHHRRPPAGFGELKGVRGGYPQ